YALQKLVVEQYCQMFTRLYGFETVTIRYFNVFGPRQDPGRPILASSLSLQQPFWMAGRRLFTATGSKRAISPTLRTSSMACCARARHVVPLVKSSTSPPAGGSR